MLDYPGTHVESHGFRSPLAGITNPIRIPRSSEQESPLILLIDDDEEVRLALSELMRSVDLEALCFASARGAPGSGSSR